MLQISVVIPLFNNAAIVAETMASVAAQSRPPADVTVVDDGSSDGGADIVGSFQDRVPNLNCVRQPRSGAAAARNRGVEAAGASWIAFLDADDVWLPRHLEVLAHGQSAVPRAQLVGNDYVESADVAKALGSLAGRDSGPAQGVRAREIDVLRAAAGGRIPFFTSTVMVEKSAFVAAGGFPSGERRGEDLALWARLASRRCVVACDYIGAIYRKGVATSATSRVLEAPDVGLRTYLAIAADPHVSGGTARFALEAACRLALAHATDALIAGRPELARDVFLPIAAPTRLHRTRLRIVEGLATLPPGLSRRLVGSWLALKQNQPL